jgi:hypothetical protein
MGLYDDDDVGYPKQHRRRSRSKPLDPMNSSSEQRRFRSREDPLSSDSKNCINRETSPRHSYSDHHEGLKERGRTSSPKSSSTKKHRRSRSSRGEKHGGSLSSATMSTVLQESQDSFVCNVKQEERKGSREDPGEKIHGERRRSRPREKIKASPSNADNLRTRMRELEHCHGYPDGLLERERSSKSRELREHKSHSRDRIVTSSAKRHAISTVPDTPDEKPQNLLIESEKSKKSKKSDTAKGKTDKMDVEEISTNPKKSKRRSHLEGPTAPKMKSSRSRSSLSGAKKEGAIMPREGAPNSKTSSKKENNSNYNTAELAIKEDERIRSTKDVSKPYASLHDVSLVEWANDSGTHMSAITGTVEIPFMESPTFDIEANEDVWSTKHKPKTSAPVQPEGKRRFMYMVCVAILLVVLSVVISVVALTKPKPNAAGSTEVADQDTNAPGIVTTNAPSVSPTSAADGLLSLLSGVSLDGGGTLLLTTTPQHKAYQWLVANPSLDNYSRVEKIQRYVMAVFYYSTIGVSWTNQKGWLSEDEECSWYTSETDFPVCNSVGEFDELDLVSQAAGKSSK